MKKIIPHLILAFVFFLLSLFQQYFFYWLKDLPIVWLKAEKYFLIYIFFFIFTFIPNRNVRFFILSYLLILNYFQMAHLSYFGTMILPNEIFLLFAEFNEVAGVLTSEYSHTLIPLIFTIVPLLFGFYFVKRYPAYKTFKFLPGLILLYFVYNPARTFFTGNTWGRQPSTNELGGMNVYLSASYFLGRILPAKILKTHGELERNSSLDLAFQTGDIKWDKVILILGESLSPNQMSLFGYERKTTPYLESLKNQDNFYFTKGLSSGVSTDISVAFFLNLTYGDSGRLKVAKGDQCLFRIAKSLNYTTHFLSIQSRQQLRYISPYLCSGNLDDLRSLEDLAPKTQNENAALDRDLLPHLDRLLSIKDKSFIVFHQRGSHAPWHLRSRIENKIFKDRNIDRRVNDYDNSVIEFDLFWKEINELLAKRDEKILLLFLSDHGESLGVNGKYGHGFLESSAFEIPMIFQSFNQALPRDIVKFKNFIPQYNFSLFLIRELGLKPNQDVFKKPQDFVIYGNDIDGFAGKIRIKFYEDQDYQVLKK